MNADEMLIKSGFKCNYCILSRYESNAAFIRFRNNEKKIYIEGLITMEQLKAINKKCEELGYMEGV